MMRRLQSVAGCISLLAPYFWALDRRLRNEGVPGDLTQNGVVDVVDVQCSILTALYEQVPIRIRVYWIVWEVRVNWPWPISCSGRSTWSMYS